MVSCVSFLLVAVQAGSLSETHNVRASGKLAALESTRSLSRAIRPVAQQRGAVADLQLQRDIYVAAKTPASELLP